MALRGMSIKREVTTVVIRIHTEHIQIEERDPLIMIYNVMIEHENRSWYETFGDLDVLKRFIEGVRAGFIMGTGGYIDEFHPQIMRENRVGETVTLISRGN